MSRNHNKSKMTFKQKLVAYKDYYLTSRKSNLDNYKNVKPNKQYILEVIHLHKKYKATSPYIINDLNFKIKKGEFHAFIGGNGAGKTTTIKSLIGAYAKYEGVVFIGGHLNFTKEAKRCMGYIPEIAKFPEGLSARDYLVSMCEMSGLSHSDSVRYTNQKLKEFNMIRLAKKSPNSFSSGQKKKILLAQALVHNPQLLIMDEPAANLDPISRIEFFNLLKNLQKKGKAIFISSHILSELDKYADSCTVLDGGKIVYTGSVKTSDHIYKVNVKNNDEFIKFINEKQIKIVAQNGANYLLEIHDSTIVNTMLENNLIYEFNLYRPSLEDIYKKYVIKGSIETMKEEI